MKATIIDFEDSFTFNLAQELSLIGFEVKVISWMDYEENPEEGLLVLGPGPGHPEDYQKVFPLILNWLETKKPLFGICLGHQLWWYLLGEEISRSPLPLHGQKVELFLDNQWKNFLGIHEKVFVQRYNSLGVSINSISKYPEIQCFGQDGEILISRSSHVLTYQFHPESVGTSFRSEFISKVWSIITK